MEETDYNIKIQNFLLMTDTGNQEIALEYLEAANWDETTAVNNFLKKSTPIDNSRNAELIDDSNISKNSENNMITSDSVRLNRNLINQNNDININIETNKKNNKKRKQNFLEKCIFTPINFLLECCTEKREVSKKEEKKIFHYLPNINDDFFDFCQLLKKKIGIIIFYTSNNIDFLSDIINQICRSTMTFNLLKNNFIIYPILANTNEGSRLQNIVSDSKLIFPSFVFCYNSSKYPSALLMKNHVLSILESEMITIKSFHNKLLEISKKLNINKDNNNTINEFDKSFGHLTDAEILNQQNFDMEKLEKEAIQKEEELKKEKLIEEKRKKEEEMKMKEIEQKAKEAKEKIVDEPNPDDPDSTTICFRYPEGDKSVNRRFLKSHTIQNLYDYITSLGDEIYTEKENNSFSLFQPFPPKKYEEMENTLEKEGLFPNAIVQIREE